MGGWVSIVCSRSLPLRSPHVSHQGVARFRLDGVEADDVIATLAVRAQRAGMLVDIASPDKVSALAISIMQVAQISRIQL